MMKFGLVDDVIPEPLGGAHWDYDEAAFILKNYLLEQIHQLKQKTPEQRFQERVTKYPRMGLWEETSEPGVINHNA